MKHLKSINHIGYAVKDIQKSANVYIEGGWILSPIFNEEDNMKRLEERLSAFLPECSRKACVLFVDDGSKDGSLKGIKEICSRHQDFFYLSFEKNAGLSRRDDQ